MCQMLAICSVLFLRELVCAINSQVFSSGNVKTRAIKCHMLQPQHNAGLLSSHFMVIYGISYLYRLVNTVGMIPNHRWAQVR